MEEQMQIIYPKNASFETVWATLQELSASQKEAALEMQELRASQKETGLQIKELRASQKETSQQIKETGLQMKETDRQMKEYNKRFGDFTNRFGEVVEYMIVPNLIEKFNEMGYEFEEASKNHKFKNKKNDIRFEVDVFLQNGNLAMLVEIKTELTISDINRHIIRLDKMRKFADLRNDSEPKVRRHFLGAVAGVVIENDVREYALNQGFFLIEPSGENFHITPPYNKPKEW
jgi:uncharacterized coiled-coil DUF342 family protein